MPPPLTELDWKAQHRIIPQSFSPIGILEDLTDPELLDEVFALESMTNDRLREEVGDLGLVAPEDRVVGPGATIVMAAFTHVSRDKPSRFSEGTYGAYYASKSQETTIRETVFHRERFLRATGEPPLELDMRVYIGRVLEPLRDVRGRGYEAVHEPDDWRGAQALGAKLKAAGAWGIVYRSVRHPGGENIAALRPPAVTRPVQGPHLAYCWDGERITLVYTKGDIVLRLV